MSNGKEIAEKVNKCLVALHLSPDAVCVDDKNITFFAGLYGIKICDVYHASKGTQPGYGGYYLTTAMKIEDEEFDEREAFIVLSPSLDHVLAKTIAYLVEQDIVYSILDRAVDSD